MRWLACAFVVACGGGSSSPPPAAPIARRVTPAAPSAEQQHAAIAEAHRKIESEQQDALGATCADPAPKSEHERCLPSCYHTEVGRAAKKLTGVVAIDHVVCRAGDALVLADEIDPKLRAKAAHKAPAAHKKGWQADVETALREKLPKGDVVIVTGKWRNLTHPLTKEALQCVTVAQYTKLRRPLDACAGMGDACEATGNAAARAINVVHYRLAEAKQAQAAAKIDDCQQAALEAVAVARGLPRWRQYAKLNVNQWKEHLVYRTRFDGALDEDALFAKAQAFGSEAEALYLACGGAEGAATKVEQEQSFHTCW